MSGRIEQGMEEKVIVSIFEGDRALFSRLSVAIRH